MHSSYAYTLVGERNEEVPLSLRDREEVVLIRRRQMSSSSSVTTLAIAVFRSKLYENPSF